MLLNTTSDLIRFKLGASSVSPLPFTSNYTQYTSTTATLLTNSGSSNGTTPVNIVPSPGSLQQNELRYCSIYNPNTAASTVIIEIASGSTVTTTFQCVLNSGDMTQYQLEKGWEVIDTKGQKKENAIFTIDSALRSNWGHRVMGTPHTSATATTAQVVYFQCLGRADKSYTTIDLTYSLSQTGSGVVWGEVGIYSAPTTLVGGSTNMILTHRRGFADNLTNFSGSGVGNKSSSISVSDISVGDTIYVAFGSNATVATPQFRYVSGNPVGITDNLASYAHTGINNSSRISLLSSMYATGTHTAPFAISWQGT